MPPHVAKAPRAALVAVRTVVRSDWSAAPMLTRTRQDVWARERRPPRRVTRHYTVALSAGASARPADAASLVRSLEREQKKEPFGSFYSTEGGGPHRH